MQPEVKNNINKEESPKQETKIQGIKAATENVQNTDKNELEKNSTANQSSNASATVEANGIDNEDSINLTIGEDEENLLAEEVRNILLKTMCNSLKILKLKVLFK